MELGRTLEISRTPVPPSERHLLRLELYAEMLLEQRNQLLMILESKKKGAMYTTSATPIPVSLEGRVGGNETASHLL